LIVDVTETAWADDAETANDAVRELAGYGVGIAVDDFGIGYTSLSRLRGLPASEIKIHQTFLSGMPQDHQDRSIIRSVIELAHGLGCRVTAEGVETPSVQRWLCDAGCDDAQGDLFSPPVPWPQVLDRYTARDGDSQHSADTDLIEPVARTSGTADRHISVPHAG
jgi:EAL domain-containing protein (putative c-di-GMP-specific phosphodiesterase class I)